MPHLVVPGWANMGNGSYGIDDGTNPRFEFPTPGPIGLDARNAGKSSSADLGDKVVSYPRRHRGQRVGDGECFTLADRALRSADAKSAADYGEVTPDADYVWGTSISLAGAQPGDVIQFRNYRYEREVETRHPDGSSTTDVEFEERPHHTAIVESVGPNGEITVLEQNSPEGTAVSRNRLFFSNRQDDSSNQSTTIKVSGSFWFYRPQPR